MDNIEYRNIQKIKDSNIDTTNITNALSNDILGIEL